MSSEFDRDTTVTALGGGAYKAQLSAGWNIGDKPNGGYLLAVALRAAAAELPLPHPFTATAHYLRAPRPGEVDLDVERVRAGRTHATAEVRMLQDAAEVVRVLTTFGDLAAMEGPTHVAAKPPPFPPIDQCLRATGGMPSADAPAIVERFDLAGHPDTFGWVIGRPSGTAAVGAWLRFIDGREPDPLALTLIVDALPPPVFNLAGQQAWVPTIELTAHVRAVPAPGWLRVWASTRFLQHGYLEEDVEVWDSTDTLVAQGRQLARLTGWSQPAD